ncbi:MAG: flagellar basal body rod protein FlgC [Clostridiales bacterium]|jgi:flagellar basal-body rod protein FlgC|nr:flagellar basal body rod protein FlgC [Clostridiales bacterium]
MGYFGALDISASGLTAERLRMDTISQNIANVNTTRTADGNPYRRKVTLFEERVGPTLFDGYLRSAYKGDLIGDGVRVASILEDQVPFKTVYDPSHPDANADGYVSMPNVEVVTEMVNMIAATRAYEANVTSINATKSICSKALEIGR